MRRIGERYLPGVAEILNIAKYLIIVPFSSIWTNRVFFSPNFVLARRVTRLCPRRVLPRGAVVRKRRTSLSAGRTPPCQRDPERLDGEVGPGAAQVLRDDHRRGCARPPSRRDGRGQIHVHQFGLRHSSVASWPRAAQIFVSDFPLVSAHLKRNTKHTHCPDAEPAAPANTRPASGEGRLVGRADFNIFP